MESIQRSAKSLSLSQRAKMLNVLNRGGTDELIKIPGIGAATIANIKKARPFDDVTDLGNVTGIGEKKFSGIVKHFQQP